MLDIVVVKNGYRGFLGIEYEGDGLSEDRGIIATKALLERVRDELQRKLDGVMAPRRDGRQENR